MVPSTTHVASPKPQTTPRHAISSLQPQATARISNGCYVPPPISRRSGRVYFDLGPSLERQRLDRRSNRLPAVINACTASTPPSPPSPELRAANLRLQIGLAWFNSVRTPIFSFSLLTHVFIPSVGLLHTHTHFANVLHSPRAQTRRKFGPTVFHHAPTPNQLPRTPRTRRTALQRALTLKPALDPHTRHASPRKCYSTQNGEGTEGIEGKATN